MSSHIPLGRAALRRHAGRAVAAALVAGSATVLSATAAHAATTEIVVDSTDLADLQAAVTQANDPAFNPGNDILIKFADNLSGEIDLTGNRMIDTSIQGGGPGLDYLDIGGSWLHVDADRAVTIDFGGDISLVQGNDLEYGGIAISSDNVTIANFANIRTGGAAIVVAGKNATIRNGALADEDTSWSETGVGLTDGAEGTVIDNVDFISQAGFGVYVDNCATAVNTTIKDSSFAKTQLYGDIFLDEFGCSAADRTEVKGLTITDTTFSSTGVWGNINAEALYSLSDVTIERATFDGAGEQPLNMGPNGLTDNVTVKNSTFAGTGWAWTDSAGSTHTDLTLTGNTFENTVEHVLDFVNATYAGARVTDNTFKNSVGAGKTDIYLGPNSLEHADNLIADNTFLQEQAAEHHRWAIWARLDGAAGSDSGWQFNYNAIDGYGVGAASNVDATEAPISVGSSTQRKFRAIGNTFGQATQGTTVAAESEAGYAWFLANWGSANARIQTWRPDNASFAGGKVSFDIAPVNPAEGGNNQPTPPLTLHVYWTADDNAEEYLGTIEDVTAAGRVSIPTTHTNGFVRVQTEGGASGYVSQYSGRAKIANATDTDGDGLSDEREAELGTDPANPDTDGDGLSDGVEVAGNVGSCKAGTNPLKADTDGDSLSDGAEVKGWVLSQKVRTSKNRKGKGAAIGRVSTNPCVADTDGDGLRDAAELKGYVLKTKVFIKKNGKMVKVFRIGKVVTNPVKADTDNDGLSDSAELKGSQTKRFGKRKSNPVDYDTDRGGASDGHEISKGADPTRTWSGPNRP
ncbi:binary toxin-like calcium binding domain-containing protein [Pimelobacter simplex]|uniref:binary toxin-like calcium binding domain-containing protein n=1 Tax=Nocardioides simplex TaxID=2045 RepID=UPI003AB04EAE